MNDTETGQMGNRVIGRLAAGGILLVAAVARFSRLGAQSLWSDEGNSVALAQRSFAEIAIRTAHDIHPPLYYWLLKIWVAGWGDSEFAVRALSAALGVLLVAVIFRLGARWFGWQAGVIAALLAAVNPFQVYYAQEARMYMLLALFGALAAFFAAEYWRQGEKRWLAGYALAASAGLYTHYAFPVLLLAINLSAILLLWRQKKRLLKWLAAQLIPPALFSPWLPIAIRQLTTWPQSLLTPASSTEKLLIIGQTLAFGVSGKAVDVRWLWVFGFLFLISGFGLFVQSSKTQTSRITHHVSLFLFLWLLLPAALTFFLFRPAYLKFLLIASPAFILFLVSGFKIQTPSFISHISRLTHNTLSIIHYSLFIILLLPSVQSLQAMYFNSAYQRDNYRGIAAYIRALGTADDTVILDAPGQQEVFGYYYHPDERHARVEPLPHQRPINPDETIAALESIAKESRRIFGVFWATEEADPGGIVEGWLNEHTFKASDVWFGNVRLVQFATETQSLQSASVSAQFGDAIELTGYQLPRSPLTPGDILQVGLRWHAIQSPQKNYTVFVQILDAENHLAGQRDAMPQKPTSVWKPGESVDDRHGVQIEPGTPPGDYRLVVGLYDATGRRLLLPDGRDFLVLATITVAKNVAPLPIEAFNISHRVNMPPLVGYDMYKLGNASNPDAPLHPGDAVHLNLYWQKSAGFSNDTVSVAIDGQPVWQGMAVPGYPMRAWGSMEIVRGQVDFFLGGLETGRHSLSVIIGKRVVINHAPVYIVP